MKNRNYKKISRTAAPPVSANARPLYSGSFGGVETQVWLKYGIPIFVGAYKKPANDSDGFH